MDLSAEPDKIRHHLRGLGASSAMGMGVSATKAVNTEFEELLDDDGPVDDGPSGRDSHGVWPRLVFPETLAIEACTNTGQQVDMMYLIAGGNVGGICSSHLVGFIISQQQYLPPERVKRGCNKSGQL